MLSSYSAVAYSLQKGNMDRLREDIARLDDDIRKATVYKEGTEQDVRQIIEELVCSGKNSALFRESFFTMSTRF